MLVKKKMEVGEEVIKLGHDVFVWEFVDKKR